MARRALLCFGLLALGCDSGDVAPADAGVRADTGATGADAGAKDSGPGEDGGAADDAGAAAQVARGSFVAKEFGTAAGGYDLEIDASGAGRLTFSDDFAVSGGQRLYVFLHDAAVDDTRGSTAMDPALSADLGPLTSITGAQSFEVSAEDDAASRRSVLVHCTISGLLFAAAPIEWR